MARRYTIKDWQQRLDAINQPLIIISSRKENKKEIFTIKCLECGNIFEADRKALCTACLLREKNKYKTKWCPICNKKRSVEGYNDVATVRKDLVKYFVNPEDAKKYSVGSHAKVLLKCPECGEEKLNSISNLCAKGFSCDYCSDNISLGNKIMRYLCPQLPLDEYDFEFSDTWTQNKSYDCYFSYNDIKYLVEVDGRQHIMDTLWSTKETQEKNDSLKNELAKNNGYRIIRIKAYKSDFDYIKNNILESELSKLFDLDNINWDVIYEKTIKSMDIAIAEYFMSHKDLYLKEIANHFHISYPTLKKTLQKMARIGLCDYNKEESFNNAMRILKERRIAV